MRVELLGLKQPDKKIQSIKALRSVSMMSLTDAKNLVEQIQATVGVGRRITILNGRDVRDEFDRYFRYRKLSNGLELNLYIVRTTTECIVMLASSVPAAKMNVEKLTQNTIVSIDDVKGPFDEGFVIGRFNV